MGTLDAVLSSWKGWHGAVTMGKLHEPAEQGDPMVCFVVVNQPAAGQRVVSFYGAAR